MAENNKLLEAPDDPANEQPLVSHLIELRNRTVKASIAVLVIFACLSPFMKQIFDFLSQPLMVALLLILCFPVKAVVFMLIAACAGSVIPVPKGFGTGKNR